MKDINIAIIGTEKVGKSKLIERLVSQEYSDTEYKTTIGSNITTLHLKSGHKLNLWDTAGKKEYQSIGDATYQNADAILICYDITNHESFSPVSELLEFAKNEAPNANIVLVGLKMDLQHTNRAITAARAETFARLNNLKYQEVSAKSGEGVKNLFSTVIRQVIEKQKQDTENNHTPSRKLRISRQHSGKRTDHTATYNHTSSIFSMLSGTLICGVTAAIIAKVAFGYDALKAIGNVCSKLAEKAQDAYTGKSL